MDKRLKGIKKQYKAEIPVSFTEHDKEQIITKIKAKKYDKQQHHAKVYSPKILSVIAIVASIFVIGTIIQIIDIQLTPFTNDGEYTEEKVSYEMKDEHKLLENESSEEQTSLDTTSKEFNPETVATGDTYGRLTVTDLKKEGEDIHIQMSGPISLTGKFTYDKKKKLMFIPNESFLMESSRTEADIVVPNYVDDAKNVEKMYNLQIKTNEFSESLTIDVMTINYIYSTNGSEIYLTLKNPNPQ